MAPPANKVVDEAEEGWEEGRRKRWGLKSWSRSISKREMDSLVAICDTFLPSSSPPPSPLVGDGDHHEEPLSEFYATSASMAGVPEHLDGMLSGGLQHPAVGLVRLALWLLSTWCGTFALCGRLSLSTRFPYLQEFSKVALEKRQEILSSWSTSRFRLLRMLFICLKFITMHTFFSQVDQKSENPTWRGIGYCGPDPDLVEQSLHESKAELKGPLHSALLQMDSPRDVILQKLQRSGFPTTTISSSSLAIRCDAVVVGSGSGGSVAASVLAKAGHKVIVLEKGHYYQRSDLCLLEGPTTSEMYEGGGLIATDDASVLVLAGSTVGGGSTINWSASLRTPDHVLRDWCDNHKLTLFATDAYRKALDTVCHRMSVQSGVAEEGFNNAVLRRGCKELGLPVADVPCNAPPDHYCGWCHLGCKDGKKQGAQETWLVDVAESGNGLIIPGCKALKVLHEKNPTTNRSRVTGVLVQGSQNEIFVIESKVAVVACGALSTPVLLKKSGLTNRHIGKHLHLHPCVMAWGYFPEEPNGWPEMGKKSYQGGILTAMTTAVSPKDDGYGAIIQTPALHPGMFSVLTPWVSAADLRERMTRFSRTAHVFVLTRDRGSGTTNYPDSLTYRLDGEDEERLRKGLEVALRVLVAAGAEEVGTQHLEGERYRAKKKGEMTLEEYLRKVRRRPLRDLRTPISSAHQMGSCRMGVEEEVSAVSPEGEAWEVEGLFVADASVLPTAVGVNPMVTIMAVAYCTAHSVLHALRTRTKSTTPIQKLLHN